MRTHEQGHCSREPVQFLCSSKIVHVPRSLRNPVDSTVLIRFHWKLERCDSMLLSLISVLLKTVRDPFCFLCLCGTFLPCLRVWSWSAAVPEFDRDLLGRARPMITIQSGIGDMVATTVLGRVAVACLEFLAVRFSPLLVAVFVLVLGVEIFLLSLFSLSSSDIVTCLIRHSASNSLQFQVQTHDTHNGEKE